MNLRKTLHQESEVFTDSLNDIIFILLMFFLIISTKFRQMLKEETQS